MNSKNRLVMLQTPNTGEVRLRTTNPGCKPHSEVRDPKHRLVRLGIPKSDRLGHRPQTQVRLGWVIDSKPKLGYVVDLKLRL